MTNFTDETITDAVLARVGQAPVPRIRDVSEALVRHLHGFVKEIEPTQEEWMAAIRFLTRTGQMCSETRQEFILLSDALGVSMLVDAICHRMPGRATETTVLGPFYVANPPEFDLGSYLGGDMKGAPLLVEGSIKDLNGDPVAGALIDTWHSDSEGFYDVQGEAGNNELAGRGRLRSDAAGNFWFLTVVPSFYPIPDDGPVGDMLRAQGRHPYRPAHIHFLISKPGLETLVTHIFLDGDKYLDSDVVFSVKDSLIRHLEPQAAGVTARGNSVNQPMMALRYDFVLSNPAQK